MERRLAAILATDVVGYSRLVRADEEGTIAALTLVAIARKRWSRSIGISGHDASEGATPPERNPKPERGHLPEQNCERIWTLP